MIFGNLLLPAAKAKLLHIVLSKISKAQKQKSRETSLKEYIQYPKKPSRLD
jgi:hypothetical protein